MLIGACNPIPDGVPDSRLAVGTKTVAVIGPNANLSKSDVSYYGPHVPCDVEGLRHHFGTIACRVLSLIPPRTRHQAVRCARLRDRAHRVLIGARAIRCCARFIHPPHTHTHACIQAAYWTMWVTSTLLLTALTHFTALHTHARAPRDVFYLAPMLAGC